MAYVDLTLQGSAKLPSSTYLKLEGICKLGIQYHNFWLLFILEWYLIIRQLIFGESICQRAA